MKKRKILYTILLMSAGIPFYSAASLNMSIDCPTAAKAGENVTCSLKATTNGTITGIQGNFSFGDCTYVSNTIKDNSLFTMPNTVLSNSFAVGNNNGLPTSFTLGNVTVKLPSTATEGSTYTIGVSNIIASDENYNDVNASNISDTVRIKSSDATLSNLTISSGVLTPIFNANTTTYQAAVSSEQITITATKNNANASVSGSGTKTLNYGSNKYDIVVTAEDGTKKTYTVTLNRLDGRENINTLSSLGIEGQKLASKFASNILGYKCTVPSDVSKVKITATKNGTKSSFVSGYGEREITLNYGENTAQVKVKSEKGEEKTYTIYITREDNRSANNNLSNITLSTGKIQFNKDTTKYNIDIDPKTTEIDINATLEDEKATFVNNYGPRKINITKDETKVQIKVKSENDTEKVYTLVFKKTGTVSSNNSISSITVNNTPIILEEDKLEYEIKVPLEVTIPNLLVTLEDEKATKVVDGPDELQSGENIYTITVTAENGESKVYTLKIIQDETLKKPKLIKLVVNGKALVLTDTKDTYEIEVDEESDKLDIDLELDDKEATYEVTGNENIKNGSIIKILLNSKNDMNNTYTLNVKVIKKVEKSKVIIGIASAIVALGSLAGIVIIKYKAPKK